MSNGDLYQSLAYDVIDNDQEEAAAINALEKFWHPSRKTGVFKDIEEINEIYNPSSYKQEGESSSKFNTNDSDDSDNDVSFDDFDYQEPSPYYTDGTIAGLETPVVLDAGKLGDIPAKYVVPNLLPHQLPVIGAYVDPRIACGFKYRIKPLQNFNYCPAKDAALFNGRALTLLSIGRGFAKRLTFEPDLNCLNDNRNYFWSDSAPEGFSFEIEAVSAGDKFTVFDPNEIAQGTLEVIQNEEPQIEISTKVTQVSIEKRIKWSCLVKVEWFEDTRCKVMPLSGTIVCAKANNARSAKITRVVKVSIGKNRKGWSLIPGIDRNARRVTVKGASIKDVPTKYTITGLEPYELPVCGTYIDPRIKPGFCYRVRPTLDKHYLFDGRALYLQGIGMGYGKRLTFESESLLNAENYFWSDTHPDGLGFETRVIFPGMRFSIIADNQQIGEAYVFRADLPQKEENEEIEYTESKRAIVTKYVHVDVTCHVRLVKCCCTAEGGAAVEDYDEHLMRVYGLAVARKTPSDKHAKIIRVDNVGLDSQLNLLFVQTKTDLTFLPIVNEP